MVFRKRRAQDKLDIHAGVLAVSPLTGLLVAVFSASLEMSMASLKPAFAYDCMTNSSGNFVCIHSVYGVPGTSLKRVVTSLNGGKPWSSTIDCANPNWDATSIYDKVCSLYR